MRPEGGTQAASLFIVRLAPRSRRRVGQRRRWRATAPRFPALPHSTMDTLPSTRATILCRDCGDRHALGRSLCLARNTTCSYCGKIGHLKKCCRSLRRLTLATQRAASATPISEVSSPVTITPFNPQSTCLSPGNMVRITK